jgi:hypothetical protein
MPIVAVRLGHKRKLQKVMPKSFINRFTSGLKLQYRGSAPYNLAHITELRPTIQKITPDFRLDSEHWKCGGVFEFRLRFSLFATAESMGKFFFFQSQMSR